MDAAAVRAVVAAVMALAAHAASLKACLKIQLKHNLKQRIKENNIMKKVIAALVLGSSLAIVPAAFAAPVELSGDIGVKYKKTTSEVDPDTSGMVYTLRVMAGTDLGKGLSAYTRLGAQRARLSSLGDINTDHYGEDKKGVIDLDQFGFKYEKDNLTYKLGRQDVTVGATALLYSRPDSNIGKKAFVDGLSVAGTVGTADVTAIFAKEDNVGDDSNWVYALRTGYALGENTNVGVTLGRFRSSTEESTNHWALDGSYKYAKSTWTAEYTKSSSRNDNTAYAVSLDYDFDGKTGASITGFRVEDNGAMGQQSDFDNNTRGIHYGIKHSLKENQEIEFTYKDQKGLNGGSKNTELEAMVTYSF